MWENILGINNISIDSDFFDIGGNSLKAISVVSRLKNDFIISINDIFKYPTIESLSENIKEKNMEVPDYNEAQFEAAADLYDNVKEDYDEYISKIKEVDKIDLDKEIEYKNILLTGSTGYVGSNILRELLINTQSHIYLLLRSDNMEKAEEKIKNQLSFYFEEGLYDRYKNRINILIGDITEEHLGLDKDKYKKLSLKIDCIINSASNVKHYGKYEEFYKTNVLGTKNLLDFAEEGLIKDFNQLSTISVGSGNICDKRKVLFSEELMDIGQKSHNVYIKSKLEGEKLVAEGGKRNINTKIFRLGNVTFNHENGKFQRNISDNGFYQNIRSFIKLNCIPKIEEEIFDFSYVDQLAKAIILLFNKKELKNQIFHIENPNKLNTLELLKLLKTRYENIEAMDMQEFMKNIAAKKKDENLREYIDNLMVHLGLMEEKAQTTFINVSDKTNAILRKLDFQWSEMDERTIEKMLDYCEKVKFL